MLRPVDVFARTVAFKAPCITIIRLAYKYAFNCKHLGFFDNTVKKRRFDELACFIASITTNPKLVSVINLLSRLEQMSSYYSV